MNNAINVEVVDGCYNIYHPIFFLANQKEYEGFIKKLYLSPLVISETNFEEKDAYICLKKEFYDYCNKVENRHNSELSDIVHGINNIYKEVGITSKIYEINKNNINIENNNENFNEDLNDNVTLKIAQDDSKTMYQLVSNMKTNQEELIEQIVMIANHSDKYGYNELDLKDVLLLYPICMQVKDKETRYVNVSLNLFHAQKFAVLKFSIPINGIQLNKNANNVMEDFIEEFSIPSYLDNHFDIYYSIVEKNIYTCIKKYCDYLSSLVSNIVLHIEKSIEFISIGKINPGTKNLENVNYEVKKAIYKVLKAPVDLRILSDSSVKKQYNEYWGTEFIRFYYSGMNRIIGIAANDLLGVPDIDNETGKNHLKIMTMSLESDIEFPIYLILFKRLNNVRTIYLMNKEKLSLIELRSKYKECEIWIISLKEKCYGTVYEFLDYMDNALQLYLQDKLVKGVIENIESIISEEQSSINKSISMILTSASFLIAAVFGLPQIEATVRIIRSIFAFSDVPYISITVISIIIWVDLLISIILIILIKKKRAKIKKYKL